MTINILENLFKTASEYPAKTAVIDAASEISYADLVDAATRIGGALADVAARTGNAPADAARAGSAPAPILSAPQAARAGSAPAPILSAPQAARAGNAPAPILSAPEQTSVVIFIDKSIDCVKAMLGTLYAGHYYVVMDTATPAERFREIISVLDNRLLITTREEVEHVAQLGYEGQVCLLEELEAGGVQTGGGSGARTEAGVRTGEGCGGAQAGIVGGARTEAGSEAQTKAGGAQKEVDEGAQTEAAGAQTETDGAHGDDLRTSHGNAPWQRRIDTDLVYVLFTSGSTGRPKGVAVTHRGLIDYVEAYVPAVGIEPDDVLGNQSPFFFDVSLRDIYMAQKTGATMCIIPAPYFATPKRLLTFLEEKQVTSIAWAATAYRIVAQFKGLQKIRPSRLRKFVFCAEAMPTAVYNYWKNEYPEGVFYQQYGLTEITGACSIYKVDREFSDEETIPIGKPFRNTQLFLIDDSGEAIPPSEPGRIGEIYVRGTGVAPGYFNDPDRTEELFVQNPLHDHYPDIVYKSGDLAYWNEDGDLVYVSRIDFQIKHGGHRIELGEIENGLMAIEGIEGCCCVHNRKDDVIVCFYVGPGVEKRDIMIGARKRLPDYMVPTVYHMVEALPVLPNGKVNRKQLDDMVNPADD